MLSIRTNMSSFKATRSMHVASAGLERNVAKLSSGFRITRASDDAAGLSVSTNLRSQINSYKMAARNAQDAISVIQTADAALDESSNILIRMRELTVQAASDGLAATEREYLSKEVQQLSGELDRIARATEYNGRSLLENPPELQFQVGIRGLAQDTVKVQLENATAVGLGLSSATDSTSGFASQYSSFAGQADNGLATSGFRGLLSRLDNAIETVAERRAGLGATENRLVSARNTLAMAMESAQQSNARISDVDVASESAGLSANQVLQQAGVSMLAQANQVPQAAVRLMSGA